MEAYYYQRMNKAHQAAYHTMKTGFTALSPSFAVPKLENRELSEIFFKLRLDCPDIFYVTGFTYRFYPGADHVELVPEYLFEKSKIKDHQKALSARVAKLVRPAQNLSPIEKERYIHDFICQNVRYDKLKKPYSHEIIGPLGQGVGVCEGIAKSVKILCDALGIWCIIAISEAAPEQGIKYRHAWNIVKLDGQFFHLDATFDNSLGQDGLLRYDYFNLDDARLFRDHQPVIYPVPACTCSDRFYYKENKLSFTKIEDVCKRAQMPIRKGLPFVFHWRGGYLTRQVLLELVEALEAAAKQKGRHAAVSYNFPQAVLCVRFPTEFPNTEAVEEIANEGELYTEST
ncbi:MAG: peptidase [Oscillibacter sp.]|nr:peptidase [Oscillibacter sp.]